MSHVKQWDRPPWISKVLENLEKELSKKHYSFYNCILLASIKKRLYIGIHAKPKPKFKSGVISESTTALNVDQTNTSVLNVDQKSTTPSAALLLPSPLAPSTIFTKGNRQEQQAAIAPTTDTGVSGSTAVVAITQKKEVGLAKAHADNKKMDARKKSLKRL
ncbi:ubiquitin-conjugating enzyme E2 22 [Fagus crenata]